MDKHTHGKSVMTKIQISVKQCVQMLSIFQKNYQETTQSSSQLNKCMTKICSIHRNTLPITKTLFTSTTDQMNSHQTQLVLKTRLQA